MSQESKQLGMPEGTAYSRLHKLVFFDCVSRLGENICFRCGKRIKSPKELSIEHKKPWRNGDPSLFWDLSNIAFSHIVCNIKAARKPNKIEWPNGQAWCCKCRKFKAIEDFPKNKLKNRDTRCRACNQILWQKHSKKRIGYEYDN